MYANHFSAINIWAGCKTPGIMGVASTQFLDLYARIIAMESPQLVMKSIPSYTCLGLAFLALSKAQMNATMPTTTEPANGIMLEWYYWLVIAIGAAAILIISLCLCICICYQCRKSQKRKKSKRSKRKRKPAGSKEEIDLASEDDFELQRNDITLVRHLGIGEYGPIYDAEVKVKKNLVTRALVKVFQKGTNQNLVDFSKDNDVLKKFNHPNVAKLIGLVSLPPYYIVCELTVNGDLKTFLLASTASADNALSDGQLVAMATDAASGLAYLERVGYIHKDVAARNCIVSQDLTVKITDFKVGRFLFRSEYAVQADGSLLPLRWMAPESIQKNEFTPASTVWSFGVLLWEVMSQGAFPYAELGNVDVITSVSQENYRLPIPSDHCPDTTFQIMNECWSMKPKQRPSMGHVRRMLESSILTNNYTTPPPVDLV